MATFKWSALASRGTVLTTELNALGNNAYSAVGTVYDNTANLDEYAYVDIVLASLTPTAGASLYLYLIASPDGTNYEDAAASTNTGIHQVVGVVSLNASTSAKRVMSPIFRLPPLKMKFVLRNVSGVSLGATTNTVTLYTGNKQSA